MLKTLCIKFPGLGEPGSAALVYQMENLGEAKETSAISRVSEECRVRTESPRVPTWSHRRQKLPNRGCRDKEREEAPDDRLANFTALPQTCPALQCDCAFLRSTSLSWKPFPTRRMQLPTLPRPWWSSWLPGAECLKIEVGKQLKSSWERYQTAWQDENAQFLFLVPCFYLTAKDVQTKGNHLCIRPA